MIRKVLKQAQNTTPKNVVLPKGTTQRSYNFGRKLDGTVATDADWAKWKEEFWNKEEALCEEYLINNLDKS